MSAPPCASILLRHAAFGRVVREQDYEEFCTAKCPATFSVYRAFCSGDVLLSHDLSSHYHRGCSVSLPCSEWERVGPPRYDHQSAEPHWRFRCFRSDASARPNFW